jgi:lysophospholipase L1-like esterase
MNSRTTIPVPKIEEDGYDWYAKHDRNLQAQKNQQFELVMIGDSITHNWCGDGPGLRDIGIRNWNSAIAKYKVLNLGFGYDRTQNVLWRLQDGELKGQSPKLIVLNIGTNQFSISPNYDGDTPEDAAEGVIAVLKQIREIAPESEVVVMAVFPRGPDRAFFDPRINRLNQLVRAYVVQEKKMEFLDISGSFLNPDGSLKLELYIDEGCHPNNAGYQVWAEALQPYFEKAGLTVS